MSGAIKGMFTHVSKEDPNAEKQYEQIDSSKHNIITSLNRDYSSDDSNNSLDLDIDLDETSKSERKAKRKIEK